MARGRGRGRRISFSRPNMSSSSSSLEGATPKIAKRSSGTRSSKRLAGGCKKKPMLLAESSSSLHTSEAGANTRADPTVASPNAKMGELRSSTDDSFIRFEAALFDELESSNGESHPHSAVPSSSPASVANPGNPNPSRPAVSVALTEMVNMFHHDPSEEPEVGSVPRLVRVHGYDVKEASAGVLADITSKHGDIVAKCPLTKSFKSRLLEIVSDIVRGLKDSEFRHMSLEDIKKNIDDVADLKGLEVDVDWLLERLEGIHKAKLVIQDIQALKSRKNRFEQERDEAKERMAREDEKMRRAQAQIDGIMESAREARLVVERYAEKGSLLNGLL